MNTASLDTAQLGKAIVALLDWQTGFDESKPKKSLLENDHPVFLIINLHSAVLKPSSIPKLLEIPHPFRTDASICVFTSDPSKKWKEYFRENPTEGVSKVFAIISMSKLRTKYDRNAGYTTQRTLCQSHDLFVCDKKLTSALTHALAAEFYKKKKQPIPVNLHGSHEAVNSRFERVKRSTTLVIAKGTTCSIRVGRSTQSPAEISANIVAVLEQYVELFPKKAKDSVQCLYVKTDESTTLPFYHSLPKQILRIEAGEKNKRKAEEDAVDESEGSEESEGVKRAPKRKKKKGSSK